MAINSNPNYLAAILAQSQQAQGNNTTYGANNANASSSNQPNYSASVAAPNGCKMGCCGGGSQNQGISV